MTLTAIKLQQNQWRGELLCVGPTAHVQPSWTHEGLEGWEETQTHVA